MNIKRVKELILFFLSMFLFFLSGCSASMQPPTETPTSLPTDTPLPTATPTKIPSPLTITGCFYKDACSYAYPIRDYINDSMNFNVEYPVIVYAGSAVWFSFNWCATDRSILIDNRKNMEFVFTIDGTSYLEALDQGNTSMQDQNDPTIFYPCFSIGGVLSGWQNGNVHQITIGAKLLADISDGWKSFSMGDYLNIFMINTTDVATPIVPTATPTGTPTLPAPTACSPTDRFAFHNYDMEDAVIYLYGPANYVFTLSPGDNEFWVCPGTYTYTAIICGYQRTGLINSEFSAGFYCPNH